MFKRLIKAWVALDHILERSMGVGCNSLIISPPQSGQS